MASRKAAKTQMLVACIFRVSGSKLRINEGVKSESGFANFEASVFVGVFDFIRRTAARPSVLIMSGTKTGVSYFCIRNRIAVQIQNLPVENNFIGKDSVEEWRSRPARNAEEQNSRKRSREGQIRFF